jgi:hypothetical protein
MAKFTIKTPTARMEIDADALSKALQDVASGPVNGMAASGAAIAQGRVPPSAKPFIRWKAVKQFPLRSGKLPKLSQMLTVPVALVVNDSWFAEGMEWGSSRKHPKRPLSSAFEALAARASRAERGRRG